MFMQDSYELIQNGKSIIHDYASNLDKEKQKL